jgi:hypothetical protein
VGDIDFRYGYIFAACLFVAAGVVYFFVIEGQGRTLEEIDTMYILHINPRESTKWIAPPPEELVTTERLVRGEVAGTGVDLEQKRPSLVSNSFNFITREQAKFRGQWNESSLELHLDKIGTNFTVGPTAAHSE